MKLLIYKIRYITLSRYKKLNDFLMIPYVSHIFSVLPMFKIVETICLVSAFCKMSSSLCHVSASIVIESYVCTTFKFRFCKNIREFFKSEHTYSGQDFSAFTFIVYPGNFERSSRAKFVVVEPSRF